MWLLAGVWLEHKRIKSHFELRYRIHVSFFVRVQHHSLESPFEALECGSATFGEVFFHRERVWCLWENLTLRVFHIPLRDVPWDLPGHSLDCSNRRSCTQTGARTHAHAHTRTKQEQTQNNRYLQNESLQCLKCFLSVPVAGPGWSVGWVIAGIAWCQRCLCRLWRLCCCAAIAACFYLVASCSCLLSFYSCAQCFAVTAWFVTVTVRWFSVLFANVSKFKIVLIHSIKIKIFISL